MTAVSDPSAATATVVCTSLILPSPRHFDSVCALLGLAVGKRISIVVLPALTVLGSKVVFLQALNQACSLFFEILKIHEPR